MLLLYYYFSLILKFIISPIGLYKLLHPLAGITNRLQGRGADIIETYNDVLSAIKDIKSTRKNIDKEFSMIFEQVERVDAKIGTQPSMPCIAKSKLTEIILKIIVLKLISDEYLQFLSLIN